MTPVRAVILGLLQGIGEFLPISSSGHLILVPWLLGWPEHTLAFDVALHLGTLCAVLTAFAADWWRLLVGAGAGLRSGRLRGCREGRLLALLALASIPGGVIGLLFERRAETVFRSPVLVAGALASLGLVLLWADRRAGIGEDQDLEDISIRDALVIGVAQALAIVPGVSRAGATISMGLILRMRRESAARFSFLLATPITFGAALRKVPALLASTPGSTVWVGMIAAAIAGFASIRFLLAYVRTGSYRPFVWYRWMIAAIVAATWLARGR